jgi:hypothetical protein
MAFGLAGALLVLGALLSVFLTGGILRVLIADVERPVMRRLVAESAALFRVNLWATVRFAMTLAFWEGLLVGAPVGILRKIAKDLPPNGPAATLASWWMIVVGLLVLANVLLRLDLARVALARGDAPTARGAYRVAKQRLTGNRGSAIALGVFWLAAFAACQVIFTRIGIAMNPSTEGGISALVVVRQLGFLALMMLRVGWWASLLAWEKRRRPMAMPVHVPAWTPIPSEPEPEAAFGLETAQPSASSALRIRESPSWIRSNEVAKEIRTQRSSPKPTPGVTATATESSR